LEVIWRLPVTCLQQLTNHFEVTDKLVVDNTLAEDDKSEDTFDNDHGNTFLSYFHYILSSSGVMPRI